MTHIITFFLPCFFLLLSVLSNPITIDSFDAGGMVRVSASDPEVSDFTFSSSIIGGERDITLFFANGPRSAVMSCAVADGKATLIVPDLTLCGVIFQWDGLDGSETVNPIGFQNPVDLLSGHSNSFQITAYAAETCFATLTVQTTSGKCFVDFAFEPSITEYYLLYQEMNKNCDLSQTISVELLITFSVANELEILYIGTAGPVVNQNPLFIDYFSEPQDLIRTFTSQIVSPRIFQSFTTCCSDFILGGQRDMNVLVASTTSSNGFFHMKIGNEQWSIRTSPGFLGAAVCQYDGGDSSHEVVVNGLNNYDLTFNGRNNAFLIEYSSNTTTLITILAYSSTVHNGAQSSFSILNTGGILQEKVILFSQFPAFNFRSLGALELSVTLNDETDVIIHRFVPISSESLSNYTVPSPSASASKVSNPVSPSGSQSISHSVSPSRSIARVPVTPSASQSMVEPSPSRSPTPSRSVTPTHKPPDFTIDTLGANDVCADQLIIQLNVHLAPNSLETTYRSCTDPSILSGERDLILSVSQGDIGVVFNVTMDGNLLINSTGNGLAVVTLQYDGLDGSSDLNIAQPPLDLTRGGLYNSVHLHVPTISQAIQYEVIVIDRDDKQCVAVQRLISPAQYAIPFVTIRDAHSSCDFTQAKSLSFQFYLDGRTFVQIGDITLIRH